RRADDANAAREIARSVVLGKVGNARTVLQRTLRDHPEKGDSGALQNAIVQMDRCLRDAQRAVSLDVAWHRRRGGTCLLRRVQLSPYGATTGLRLPRAQPAAAVGQCQRAALLPLLDPGARRAHRL